MKISRELILRVSMRASGGDIPQKSAADPAKELQEAEERLEKAQAAKKVWNEKTLKGYMEKIHALVRSFQEPLKMIEDGEDATANLKSIIGKMERIFGELEDEKKRVTMEVEDAQDDVEFLRLNVKGASQ